MVSATWPPVMRCVQNLRRGHHDIATHVPSSHRLRTVFAELAVTIWPD